ncbi:hypothetical protein FACS1894200_00770 [Spirochaetia bacterium]|nr:hypothetical protein FACS1894200_00770 [Spirochaetia bacterium]
MTRRLLCTLAGLCFFTLFLLTGCDQDPIFYHISNEVPPKDPRIKGTPTDIVKYGSSIYVASMGGSTVHQYENGWNTISAPGGKVRGLAATSNPAALYALTFAKLEPSNSTVKKYNGSWSTIVNNTGYTYLQKICAAEDKLFVWASQGYSESGAILYEDGGDLKVVLEGVKTLNGAVKGTNDGLYYLGTASGLYSTDLSTTTQINSTPIMGVTKVTGNDTIVAAARGSILYKVGSTAGFSTSSSGDRLSGGMAVYDNGPRKFLLFGLETTSSTNQGYREMALSSSGDFPVGSLSLRHPGDTSPSTVNSLGQYDASIGIHAVRHIFHVGGDIIFASTAKDGLWSYRGEWNGED